MLGRLYPTDHVLDPSSGGCFSCPARPDASFRRAFADAAVPAAADGYPDALVGDRSVEQPADVHSAEAGVVVAAAEAVPAAAYSAATRTGGRFVPRVPGDSAADDSYPAEARADCSAAAGLAWAGLPEADWDRGDCLDDRYAAPVDCDDCSADSSPAGCLAPADSTPAGYSVAAQDDYSAAPKAVDRSAREAAPVYSAAADSVQVDLAEVDSARVDSARVDSARVDSARAGSAADGLALADLVAGDPADWVAADCSVAPLLDGRFAPEARMDGWAADDCFRQVDSVTLAEQQAGSRPDARFLPDYRVDFRAGSQVDFRADFQVGSSPESVARAFPEALVSLEAQERSRGAVVASAGGSQAARDFALAPADAQRTKLLVVEEQLSR